MLLSDSANCPVPLQVSHREVFKLEAGIHHRSASLRFSDSELIATADPLLCTGRLAKNMDAAGAGLPGRGDLQPRPGDHRGHGPGGVGGTEPGGDGGSGCGRIPGGHVLPQAQLPVPRRPFRQRRLCGGCNSSCTALPIASLPVTIRRRQDRGPIRDPVTDQFDASESAHRRHLDQCILYGWIAEVIPLLQQMIRSMVSNG